MRETLWPAQALRFESAKECLKQKKKKGYSTDGFYDLAHTSVSEKSSSARKAMSLVLIFLTSY